MLTPLGLSSFLRVLPAFMAKPWLPVVGTPRRTRRTVVRRLLTFLRLRAVQEGCFKRDDFTGMAQVIGNNYSERQSNAPMPRTGIVTCMVTLDLIEHLVDRMLEEVTEGRHESLDDAVAVRLNPVQETYWREPKHDDGSGDYRGG